MLATEPEALLPFLADGSGPVLSAARTAVLELFARYLPALTGDEQAVAADAATRSIVSYAISPGEQSAEQLGEHLAELMVNGVGADAAVTTG